MHRNATRRPLTPAEMDEALIEKKERYSPAITKAIKDDALCRNIEAELQILNTIYAKGDVNLNNPDEIIAQANAYLEACARNGIPPTFLSLCNCLGYSQQGIYERMRAKPNDESTKVLRRLQGAITSIIATQGLLRNYSEAMSIFLLKNSNMGMKDNPEEVPIDNTIPEDQSAEALARQFKEIYDQSKAENRSRAQES